MALCGSCAAFAQTPGAVVTVTVEGVHSGDGRVTGSLCVDPQTPYCSTYVAGVSAVEGRTELRFTGVAPGRYSLSIVHDEDGDGRTEIPPEGFALGNNAPAPDFEASSIQIAGDTATAVTMTYPGSSARRLGSRGVEPSQGIVRSDVREAHLYGELYAPKDAAGRLPAIILIDGSTPGLDGVSVIAAAFAREGFAALALAYFGEEGLPPTLEDVPLEYFDTAVAALKARPEIDAAKIGVFGVSRGAEAAFLLAARNPAVRAVAAAGPSGVVWRGYDPADPANSDPAWTVAGQPLPFLDPDLSLYDPNGAMTPMFTSALTKSDARSDAVIPVERINGPILLISGQDDEIWPSPDMARRIVARLLKAGFAHNVENVVYAGSSHYVLTTSPAAMTRVLSFFRQTLGE
jgi:dienelactone hydrolase/uncharacterized protein (DUF2141 family)